jgi:uncharacterized protein
MKLDLTELARTIGMRAVQDIDEPCPADMDVECTSNVTGRIQLSNTGSVLVVNGEIRADVKLQCSRCLEDFSTPLQGAVDEQFRLEKTADASLVLPLDEEDVDSGLVRGNLLDVSELIRQNLLLDLPIKPLCRPDCAGLCPTCGENLNVRKCACPPAEIESPFKVLADLLEEEKDT